MATDTAPSNCADAGTTVDTTTDTAVSADIAATDADNATATHETVPWHFSDESAAAAVESFPTRQVNGIAVTEVPLAGTTTTMDFVDVPAGEFWAGCNDGDPDCADEGPNGAGYSSFPGHAVPQRKIYVSYFQIGRTEVSWGQFLAADVVSVYEWAKEDHVAFTENLGDDYPVVRLKTNSLRHFCERAVPGGRLPTAAEWEKAARGGCETYANPNECKTNPRAYPWGQAAPSCATAVFGGKAGAELCGRPFRYARVDSLPLGASVYGAINMAGNAPEAVEDERRILYGVVTSDPNGGMIGWGQVDKGVWLYLYDWGADFDSADARGGDAYAPLPHYLKSHADSWQGMWGVGVRCARDVSDGSSKP